jgi:hypothetical protein
METDKLVAFVKNITKNTGVFIVAVIIIIVTSFATTVFTDYFKRSKDIAKSDLQSKLLWNNIGQCFYVELDDFNKYYKIVRVIDCDKTK